jgi:hypothetical protein
MDTASFQFVLFGLAAALISNLSRSRVWRSAVLLAASILFLALIAPHPLVFLPLTGFLLLGYGGLVLLQRGWSRTMVWSILAVLLAYIWLKKYTFLPEGIFLHSPYITLGLSYIFFRVLHLIIETGDGCEKRRIGFGAYLLYTLNFTTLISGPIQRYDEFARDQFAAEPIALGPRVVGLQLERMVRGFFKVNVLAVRHGASGCPGADVLPVTAIVEVLCRLPPGYRVPSFPLCEFLRLHRHRDRPGAADARSPAGKLRPPLLGLFGSGLLEPVAHDSLQLAQDLCL